MSIGMFFHHRVTPRPPPPSFIVKIPSRLSTKPGSFNLVFYVPEGYHDVPENYRFPVVVNYHGGGFIMGTGTDDARFARSVIDNVKAVLVSVEYRLAPEYPFSVGVEDSTDAVIYLAAHADELRLDPHQIALSGFSAGGNYALTVPIILHHLKTLAGKRRLHSCNEDSSVGNDSRDGSSTNFFKESSNSSSVNIPLLESLSATSLETCQQFPPLTIRALVSFYPPTDFRIPRAQKRATNPKPHLNLPKYLSDLFDECYHDPAYTTTPLDLSDPYLSPAAASDELLRAAYPELLVLYTCEYDMLNPEGIAFGERLKGPGIGKTVKGGLIREVVHAFDKIPDLDTVIVERCYAEACGDLNAAFGREENEESMRQLDTALDIERFDDPDDVLGSLV
jgi:acetyl esterase/lipase